jgi:O-antigen/teichoic acid export membrane protein
VRSADHRARLLTSSAWLLLARVGTQGLLVLFTIVVARRLGEIGLGEYAFVASAVVVANVLSTFGTDMLLMRDIAGRGDLSRVGAAFAIQLAVSVALIALAMLLAPALPNQRPETIAALEIYSFALLPLAAFTVLTAVLRGLGRFDLYTLLNLAVSGVQVGAAALFVGPSGGVISVAVLLLATQLFAAAFAGVLCMSIPGFWRSWRFRRQTIVPLVRDSAPIALLGVLGMFYQRSAVYVLAILGGPALTGQFSAAARAVEAAKTGHLSFFTALYPALAQAHAQARIADQRPPAFTRSLVALLALAVVLAALLAVLADPLVSVLFGPGFGASSGALRIIAWALVPYTVNSHLSLAYVAAGREGPVARALAGSLLALVMLAGWWIPMWGLLGACWAALAAESLQAVMLLTQWRTEGALPWRTAIGLERELPHLS